MTSGTEMSLLSVLARSVLPCERAERRGGRERGREKGRG
jgi:hypothetical protein